MISLWLLKQMVNDGGGRLLMELNSGSNISDTFPQVLSPRKTACDVEASFWPPRSPAADGSFEQEGKNSSVSRVCKHLKTELNVHSMTLVRSCPGISVNHQVEKINLTSTGSDSTRDSINDTVDQKLAKELPHSSSPESVSKSPEGKAQIQKKAPFNGWSIRFRVSSPRSVVGLLYDQQLLQHFGNGIQFEQPRRISVAFQKLVCLTAFFLF